jgi:hypothetical protein
MTEYYNISDFEKFKDIIKYPSLESFVSNLNYVIEENRINDVCDYMIVMKEVFKLQNKLYHILRCNMNMYNNNTLGVYTYLKFILLDITEQRAFIDKYFNKCFLISKMLENSVEIEEILKITFELVEDDYLNDFIDYKDNYSEYRKLNINNLDRINNINIDYVENEFIIEFITNIRIISNCKFLVNLIYYISDINNTKIVKKDEISITTLENFMRRFNYNKDIYMILYNFINNYNNILVIYKNEQFLKDHISKIPYNRLYNNENILNEKSKNHYIKILINSILNYRIINDNIYSDCRIFIFNISMICEFLSLKYNYDKFKDEYKICSTMDFNKRNSDILYIRYYNYFESKLYKSLELLFNVIRILTMEKVKNQDIIELHDYLKHILEIYNYDKFFNYNIRKHLT